LNFISRGASTFSTIKFIGLFETFSSLRNPFLFLISNPKNLIGTSKDIESTIFDVIVFEPKTALYSPSIFALYVPASLKRRTAHA